MKTLHIKNLTVRRKNQCLVDSLSLTLHPGTTWGILGPNGCGKTTLLQTLAGLQPITQGEILLDHIPLQQLGKKRIAQSIGLLFQNVHPTLPQRVREHCLDSRFPHRPWFAKASAEDHAIIQYALEKMELELLSERAITQLSGGEIRRLAIAALLCQTPVLFLLDEPTNHLDIRHQMTVLNHFRELTYAKKAAVVMTLHDIHLARAYCDNVLLMFPDGKWLLGPCKEMMTREHLAKLYGIDSNFPGFQPEFMI